MKMVRERGLSSFAPSRFPRQLRRMRLPVLLQNRSNIDLRAEFKDGAPVETVLELYHFCQNNLSQIEEFNTDASTFESFVVDNNLEVVL